MIMVYSNFLGHHKKPEPSKKGRECAHHYHFHHDDVLAKSRKLSTVYIYIQGVLDYRDLNYRAFAIPGLIKYSIYRNNSLIIRRNFYSQELIFNLVIPIIKDSLYVVDKELQ